VNFGKGLYIPLLSVPLNGRRWIFEKTPQAGIQSIETHQFFPIKATLLNKEPSG